jgi:putative ABC transport system permease protein
MDRAEHGSMAGLGLLKPGVTPALARADLDAIMHRLALADSGPESDHHTSTAWLADFGTDDVRKMLLMLMGAVGLVLIIDCANVASLLLARSTARTREIAIRSAIGAGRSRLGRQLLTENFVISAVGGAVGLLLAGVCLRALVLAGPRDIPRLWDAGLNLPVLFFTATVTVTTGLLAGLAPVLSVRRVDLMVALKEGSPATGGGRRGHSVRSGLVISEIAVTFVLSFGCGLLLRSLSLAQTVYPGFDAPGLLALELYLPPSRYKSDGALRQFYAQLTEDLRREPGVKAAGTVNCPLQREDAPKGGIRSPICQNRLGPTFRSLSYPRWIPNISTLWVFIWSQGASSPMQIAKAARSC